MISGAGFAGFLNFLDDKPLINDNLYIIYYYLLDFLMFKKVIVKFCKLLLSSIINK
jgi:hypothetical protein